MDELFGRTASGLFYVVKNSAVVDRDQSPKICSRVRCSSRVNPVKGKRTHSDKSLSKRYPSLSSTNSKEATGIGSSPQATVSRGLRKSSNPPKKLCFSHDDRDGSSKLAESNASRESVPKRARSSSSDLCSRHGKKAIAKSELGITDSSMVSSTPLSSKNGDYGSRIGSSSSRYSCKNLRNRLSNDVESSSTQSSSLSPKLIHDRRRVKDRKKIRETESDSRGTRNFSSARSNEATSATKTRRAARTELNLRSKPIRAQQIASSGLMARLPQPGVSRDTNASTLECPSRRPNSFTDREDVRQYDLEVIDEHFLLGTNHFRRGLGFHDPHRDMRLDIDNMSYEELLALEERMGSVTTALPEEALAKCLKKSIYQAASDAQGTGAGDNGDDIKCSICLEEYKGGDEVGRLLCEHSYHVACIEHWLQLKNWCPFCKASLSSSP